MKIMLSLQVIVISVFLLKHIKTTGERRETLFMCSALSDEPFSVREDKSSAAQLNAHPVHCKLC